MSEELSQKYKAFENQVRPWLPTLQKAGEAILVQEISKYPVFVFLNNPLEIGIPLVQSNDGFFIHLSTLEELATKKIVRMERVDEFRKVFKPAQEEACFLFLSGDKPEFLFIPY